MIRRLIAISLAASLAARLGCATWPAFADEVPRWTVDPEASRVGFTATQMNAPFEGHFSDVTADIAFAPENPAGSHARVEIGVASLDTGNAERDATALSADWFNAEEHPVAVFEASEFKALDDGRFAAIGSLTLRGETRDVVLPFTLAITEEASSQSARVTGALEIDRTDYGVGQGQWSTGAAIGLAVVIDIALTATREP